MASAGEVVEAARAVRGMVEGGWPSCQALAVARLPDRSVFEPQAQVRAMAVRNGLAAAVTARGVAVEWGWCWAGGEWVEADLNAELPPPYFDGM